MRGLISVLVAMAFASPVTAAHDVDYEKYLKKHQERAESAAKDHPRAVVMSRVCSTVRVDETDEEEWSTHEMCLDVVDFPQWMAQAVLAGKLTGTDLIGLVREINRGQAREGAGEEPPAATAD